MEDIYGWKGGNTFFGEELQQALPGIRSRGAKESHMEWLLCRPSYPHFVIRIFFFSLFNPSIVTKNFGLKCVSYWWGAFFWRFLNWLGTGLGGITRYSIFALVEFDGTVAWNEIYAIAGLLGCWIAFTAGIWLYGGLGKRLGGLRWMVLR